MLADLVNENSENAYDRIGVALLESFDAYAVTWNLVEEGYVCCHQVVWPAAVYPALPPGGRVPTPQWQPLLRWHAVTGDKEPMILDRVPPVISDRRMMAEHRDNMRPLQAEHQLAISISLPDIFHAGFVLGRPGDDFSETDLRLARILQPLLTMVLRQHSALRAHRPGTSDRGGLTERELTVLVLLQTGASAQAIGHRLNISPRTVRKHLEHVYRKLRVSDRLTAIVTAQDRGILPSPDVNRLLGAAHSRQTP